MVYSNKMIVILNYTHTPPHQPTEQLGKNNLSRCFNLRWLWTDDLNVLTPFVNGVNTPFSLVIVNSSLMGVINIKYFNF